MSDQYTTAKNTLLKKHKTGFRVILILALCSHFPVFGANMPDAFKGFGFNSRSDEAANFLAATPGSQFNLSIQEFQAIKATSSTQPDAASQTYRKILLQRWQAYRKNGLKGIATYDRGDGIEANPGEELRTATLDSMPQG